ncbi:unnamed protein product [Rhodiola kirilowii]
MHIYRSIYSSVSHNIRTVTHQQEQQIWAGYICSSRGGSQEI